MAQCQEIRPGGYRCVNSAPPGREVCASHDPRRQCGATTVSGGRCKRMKVRGQAACTYHL